MGLDELAGHVGISRRQLERIFRKHLDCVPTRYYLEFVRSNRLFSAVQPLQIVTYEEYIEELLGTDRFRSDSEYRFEMLDSLRVQKREVAGEDQERGSGFFRKRG